MILSVPHKTQAIVSGQVPCSSFCLSINLSTTDFAAATAAVVGIDCGSSAWIFLPLGKTPGFLMGSPPGPGKT